MRFFSLRPRKTEAVSVKHSLFSGRCSRTMRCLILLTLLYVLVPVSVTLAATRPHQTHPLNIQALRTALKSKIRVTHTGHIQRAKSTPLPRPINATEPAYNNTAISDDQKSTTANFDGQAESYSAQDLQNLGLAPGLNVTVGTITYSWPNVPSGAADNYQSAGQTLSVPSISDAATIGFLGAATNGDSSGTATLTFTDGSTTTFTLGLTDWTLGQGTQSQPSFGNTIVKTSMPSLNTLIDQQSTPSYLFTALQALPAGKTLQSITLPTTTTGGQLHIFAIGLSGPAYNNTATSDDSNTTTANIDAQGNSFSAQALNSADVFPGQQFVSSDLAFTLPSAVSGTPNNYQANGQTLPVIPVANATIVGFLGTATNGATSGTATATYTDGSTQTFTLGFADWAVSSTSSLPYHDSVAATMSYLNTKSGKRTLNNYVFTTEVAIDSTRTLQSITLPSTVTGGQLHVFAVSTRSLLNNIGTSLDSAPGSSSIDGIHDSYSAQTLLNANILPGQPVIYDGVSFLWPGTYGTIGDNYQAAGQVLSVNPVPQATTVAFIGSSTQGASSGTATLTYTDGSTQTFTLGFTDWCTTTLQFNNQVVARFPYRNAPSGEQTSTCGLYYASTSLQVGKTLQSVTLPTITTASQMHIFAIGTRSNYNNIGISNDDTPRGANFDNYGASYSAQDFTDPNGPGWNPGDTLTYQGINYVWPGATAGQSDNYIASGQTVPVTPVAGATTVGFVGSADEAFPSSSGTATLTYTDGSTTTFTLGMTDWIMDNGYATPPQPIPAIPLASNRLFMVLPHINIWQGARGTSSYLFEMETPLTAGKTLKSVTLPSTVNQGRLHIFMIGTRASTDVMNNVGTSDDSQSVFASFDSNGASNGASYSNQALESTGLYAGQPFLSHGVSFTWSPSYSVVPDNFQAAGQTLPITPVPNANTLAFLGAATQGSSSGTATIIYSDGTTQTFTLGFADWNTSSISSLPYNDSIAASMSYRNTVSGQQTINTSVFETEVPLQANKTVQSVTLPTTVTGGQLHVFSVGTRAGPYNNASTSDDSQPSFANFDGNGGSYSMQALQMAGVTAGQTVTVNGTSFTWPNEVPGFFNNYQAAGQVVNVASKSNASTLAFLGSATSGPSSGTATITYSDGTTQTFTLSFADWNVSSTSSLPSGNSVAFTMSYRNATARKQTVNTYVFYTSTPIKSGKTVKSVTLPTSVTQGQLHVFASSLK
jgi:hypothetical protein